MNKRARRWGLLTVAVAVSLFAAACGDDGGSSSATTGADGGASTSASGGGAATTGGEPVSGTLQGSGSTFQLAFQQEAASEFGSANSGAHDHLRRRRLRQGSHGPRRARSSTSPARTRPSRTLTSRPSRSSTSRSCSARSPSRTTSRRRQAAALEPDTIAKIFQREIKKWNDPAIAADNPGVKLPDTDITVAHRSDGSGTTQNFTKYLVEGRARRPGRSRAVRPSSGRPTPRPATATRASPRSCSRPTARSATSTSPTPRPPASSSPR